VVERKDRVARLWAEYQPLIEAAKAADGSDRHSFFVDLIEERVGDFPAVLLTIERYLLMSVEGVFDSTEDDPVLPVLRFLWFVSPDFDPSAKAGRAFLKKHRNLDPAPYPALIRDYLDGAFRHAPPRRGTLTDKGRAAPAEWVSSVVDMIASEYGWTETDILRTPLARLFLYLGRIRSRLSSEPISFTQEADRLQDEFMRKANAEEEA